jgi:hypothetical protein
MSISITSTTAFQNGIVTKSLGKNTSDQSFTTRMEDVKNTNENLFQTGTNTKSTNTNTAMSGWRRWQVSWSLMLRMSNYWQ